MSITMVAPVIPEAMADFGSDNAVVAQLLVSIQVVGVAAGSLVLSPLSERYGRSPLMHATNLAFMIAAIVCALRPSIPVLIVGRLVMGICTISLGGAYIADLMDPEDRGMALNVWNVGPVLVRAMISFRDRERKRATVCIAANEQYQGSHDRSHRGRISGSCDTMDMDISDAFHHGMFSSRAMWFATMILIGVCVFRLHFGY